MTAHVCLATFNGERWLREQIESIRDQHHADWRLWISDHGSEDRTIDIAREFTSLDERIELLPSNAPAGGPAENFQYLLATLADDGPAADDAIFLCDQDDRWDAQKLERQVAALNSADATFADLVYLSETGASAERRVLPTLKAVLPATVESLLAQNSVVGCTLGFRPAVLDLALPFPEGLVNHDWWLALCALCVGELVFVDEPLVAYRQHADNAVGGSRPWRQLLSLPSRAQRQKKVLVSQIEGARLLCARLEGRGLAVPEALTRYLRVMDEESGFQRAMALRSGEFAAPALGVRVLRTLAALRI